MPDGRKSCPLRWQPSLSVAFLDQPLLITGDEPVIVNVGADYPQHQPDCFITKEELARRRRAGLKSGKTWSQIVHIYYTRPSGVADALEIALPLTPKSILFLGPIGGYGEPQARLRGAEAEHLASKVNEHVITQSLSWVAANPAHPHFTSMDFPPPAPLIAVCDGGPVMSEQLRNAPEPRRPRLCGIGSRPGRWCGACYRTARSGPQSASADPVGCPGSGRPGVQSLPSRLAMSVRVRASSACRSAGRAKASP